MQAGNWLKEQHLYQQATVVNYQFPSWSFAFYGPKNLQWEGNLTGIMTAVKTHGQPLLLYTHEDQLPQLQTKFKEVKLLKSFQNFHVSQLNLQFLDHNIRKNELENYLLLICK